MTTKPLSFANIHWINEQQGINVDADDRYFSDNPIAESDYVYLQGNELARRWQQSRGNDFTILELGYGTGLNFLLTQRLWCETQLANQNNFQHLNYISIDRSPIKTGDLQKFYKSWPQLAEYSQQLIHRLPMPVPGCHLLQFSDKEHLHSVDLFIHYAEAESVLDELVQNKNCRLDAIYLDGFSPRKNPALWTHSLFGQLANLSQQNTSAASFSASSEVKRNLVAANFKVSKKPGFGKKREMITAIFDSEKNTGSDHTSKKMEQKFSFSIPHQSKDKVLVIGAGLAGILTASKLSSRGFKVDVMEANAAPCEEASGNAVGLAYPKLSNVYDSSCSLHCCAFDYLTNEIKRLDIPVWGKNHLAAKGLIYLLQQNKTRMHAGTPQNLNIPEEHIRYLNQQQTSKILATDIPGDSLLFTRAMALSPKLMANHYLSASCHNSNIKFYFNTFVEKLIQHQHHWQAVSQSSKWDNYQAVFLCCGHQLHHLLPQYSIYTDQVKGQIDRLDYQQQLPEYPICGNGYAIPCDPAEHSMVNENCSLWVGASFHRNTADQITTTTDTSKNIARACQLLNASEKEFQWTGSRASTRLTSSDRLPLVGQVHYQPTKQIAFLQDNKMQTSENTPGLFINTAFGSHGLTLIPLLSEYVVRLFNSELMPINRLLMNALDAERFAKRAEKHSRRQLVPVLK